MHDLIAIGDIVTDAFIRLGEGEARTTTEMGKNEICLPFAEKIPYEFVEEVSAVGNSPNAAVSAAKLGVKSALVTNLGDDKEGLKCLETLKRARVDTRYVSTHEGEKSNYHYVLWYKNDRTILVKHEKYGYKLPSLESTKWLYLSSLGEDTLGYHGEIASYLQAHPETKLAFQPGTFQMTLGKEALKDIYAGSTIFFCNVEEAGRILGETALDIKELLKRMRGLGPQTVVITDGPKGAYAYDGESFIFQPPYPDQAPAFERTGAGDAFASTTVAALSLGKDLPTALAWASANAMSVVQKIGAQAGLLTSSEIESYIESASEDFGSKSI